MSPVNTERRAMCRHPGSGPRCGRLPTRGVLASTLSAWIAAITVIIAALVLPRAEAVSILLRDGTVLDYGHMEFVDQAGAGRRDRRYVPKDPVIRRIDLPEGAPGIHEVIVDGPAGRVFVVPQLPIGQHGVLVLDRESLRVVGFLPGVHAVTVPRHPEATHVFLHRAVFDGSDESTRVLAEHADEPLAAMQKLGQQVERISRTRPERLSRLRLVNHRGALLACERVRGRGYPGYTVVDDESTSFKSTRRWNVGKALEARAEEERTRGYAADCWADGSLLRKTADPYAPQQCAIERRDRTMGPWKSVMRGEGGCEPIAELTGIVRIGDSFVELTSGRRLSPGRFDFAVHFPAGASATAYFGTRYSRIDGREVEYFRGSRDPTRVGPPIRIVSAVGESLVVGTLPLGPNIDRVEALRALDARIRDALICDADGRPVVGQTGLDRPDAIRPPECIDVPKRLRSAFTAEEAALAARLPVIEIVGVIGDP